MYHHETAIKALQEHDNPVRIIKLTPDGKQLPEPADQINIDEIPF